MRHFFGGTLALFTRECQLSGVENQQDGSIGADLDTGQGAAILGAWPQCAAFL